MFTFVIAYNVVEFDFNNWTVGIRTTKAISINDEYLSICSLIYSEGQYCEITRTFRMLCNENNSAVPSITQTE